MKHASEVKSLFLTLRSPWEDRQHISVFKSPFFLAGYVLWLVVAILNTTMLARYFGHVNFAYAIVPFLMLLHEIVTIKEHSLKDYLLIVALLFANLMTYLHGHDNIFAFSILLFCGRYLLFKSIAKLTLIVQSVVFFIVIVCSQFGLIPDRLSGRFDGTIRHSLGFVYVTYPSYVLLNIVLLLIYYRNGKLKVYETITVLAANTYVYIMTDARNGCGLVYIAVIGVLLISFWNACVKNAIIRQKVAFILGLLLCNSYTFFAAIFFLCTFFYALFPNSSLMTFIDGIMSTRLSVSSQAVSKYGVPLIGGTNINLPAAGTIIDSSYLRIIFDHGLILFLVVLILLFLEQIRAFRIQNYWLLYVQLFVAAHSCFDAQLLTFQMNTFLFILLWGVPSCVRGLHSNLPNSYYSEKSNIKEI